jgi:glucans biosynthesis protein C
MAMSSNAVSESAMSVAGRAVGRNAGVDRIRVLLTALVIFHHTAITYGGSGGWYWREQPNASSMVLLMLNAVDQAYFMGFFFLLAGYYTPSAYERKGPATFWKDRLLRLGVPLLIYFFVLSPLTIALANTSKGSAFWSGWWRMTRQHEFGPGPLWFAEALLLFAAGHTLWRAWRPGAAAPRTLPRFGALAATAIGLGAASFLVRLLVPVGHEVLWLQLGYFPCYIYLFAAGCAASHGRLLEHITWSQARPWLIVSAVALITMPLVLFVPLGQGAFEGGWTSHAAFYAWWDPFVACGIILGLLALARTTWARPSAAVTWLAGSAYAAYIIHPPIVVGFSLLAAHWSAPPLLKFAVVGTIAGAASFAIGGLLRAMPGARKVL